MNATPYGTWLACEDKSCHYFLPDARRPLCRARAAVKGEPERKANGGMRGVCPRCMQANSARWAAMGRRRQRRDAGPDEVAELLAPETGVSDAG